MHTDIEEKLICKKKADMETTVRTKAGYQPDEAKLRFFRTFGYAVFKQLFTKAELQLMEDEFKREISEVPATALASEPGDVVAFDIRLWHSSMGGSVGRRMSTVVYYGNPKNDAELKALQYLGESMPASNCRKFDCKRRYLYSKHWVSNPYGSPDRQRWIDRLREIGFLAVPGMVEGN